jgi:hypothetical protein
MSRSLLWRSLFVVAALGILTGGPLHPLGTIAEMIAHPHWTISHTLQLAGYVALLGALVVRLGDGTVPERSRRWTRWAILGTIVQVVEMVFHTLAARDHANLMAGRPTPILSAHLGLAVVCYPIFAVTLIGFIVATTRERVLGSNWFAWIGVLGTAAHGLAPVLVVALGIISARVLFPMVLFLAVWLLLAAVWRTKTRPEATSEFRAVS